MGSTASAIRQPSFPRSPAMAYPSRCILRAVPSPPILPRSRRRSSRRNCVPRCCAQMRLAEFAADGLNNALARAVLPFCLRVWPGVMRVTARLTRVAQHAAVAPHSPTEIEPCQEQHLDVKPPRRDAMKSFAVFALAVLLAPAAFAQHQTFVVNPDASEVKITLKTTHELVNGTFHVQSGSIEFDPGTPKMSGSVVVLAGSGKTGNDSRDKRMNKDILQGRTVRNGFLRAEDLYRRHRSFRRLQPSRSPESSHCWARLTRSPSPCWCILRAQAQRPRLILSCRTSNGD